MNTTKLNCKRIAAVVIVAFILVLSLTVCAACGYIVVSLKEISATYSGDSVEVGGTLDKADIVVTAKYSNNTSKVVTNYELNYDFSEAGQRLVTVSYGYAGQSREATFYVTVSEKSVDPEPAKTLESITAVYNGQDVELGGELSKSDIAVTAHYSDNSSKTVTNFTFSGFDSQTAGDKQVTVTYTEDGATKTTTVTVVVKESPVTLQSITAKYTGQPITMGNALNKEDIDVTAKYSNDSSKTVTDFTFSGFDSQTAGEKTVTVTYVENDIIQECTVTVTVTEPEPPATLVSITAEYTGQILYVGDQFGNSKITVRALYSDNSSKIVTDFTRSGFSSTSVGDKTVTITYSEGDVTVTTTVVITVHELPVTLASITAEYVGEDIEFGGELSKSDIAVTAHYSDNGSKSVTDFTYSGFDSSAAGQKEVTVTYVENDVTKTAII